MYIPLFLQIKTEPDGIQSDEKNLFPLFVLYALIILDWNGWKDQVHDVVLNNLYLLPVCIESKPL